MTRVEINDYIKEYMGEDSEEEILLLDGLDEAFIGLTDDNNIRAVYSVNKIIECLSKDMTEEEAYEYYDYNIQCAYVGEKTPVYIKTVCN